MIEIALKIIKKWNNYSTHENQIIGCTTEKCTKDMKKALYRRVNRYG